MQAAYQIKVTLRDWHPPTWRRLLVPEDLTLVLVRDVLQQPGDRLRYVYDLGDNWRHDVLLEKVQRADPEQRLPICLKGKRACPLEDRGGPFTCEDITEVLADPGHEDHAEILELVGEDYDPDAFDLEAANRRLAGLTGRWG